MTDALRAKKGRMVLIVTIAVALLAILTLYEGNDRKAPPTRDVRGADELRGVSVRRFNQAR